MADASTIIAAQEDFAMNAVALVNAQLAGMGGLNLSVALPTTPPIPLPGYGYDTTTTTNAILTALFPAVPSITGIVSSGAPTFTPGVIGDEIGRASCRERE